MAWGRMLPSLVAATAVLALLAVASQVLWLAREPYLPNPWLNFDDAGLHGPILLAKGLAAYGVGWRSAPCWAGRCPRSSWRPR